MAMTLRLTDEQDAALTSLASSQGISKNDAAVRAIEAELSRLDRARRIEAATDDAVTRYADTLRRLGE